jgi:hypothetical protein
MRAILKFWAHEAAKVTERFGKPIVLTASTLFRCRLCGDHRRVISGRHLSKHGTNREEYMEEWPTKHRNQPLRFKK